MASSWVAGGLSTPAPSTPRMIHGKLTVNTHSSTIGSIYLCHACADSHGLLNGLHLVSTSPSSYQVEKARKHVGPTSTLTSINSVLNSGSTSEYDNWARKALQKGILEIEPNGCRSLVYPSTENLGTRFMQVFRQTR